MMINEKLFAWSKKSNGYQRFRICLASQVYKHIILPIAVISLSLLNPHNSAYAQSGAGPGSYTAPRSGTGNGDFKALKAIEHLWYVWLKGPRPTPGASSSSPDCTSGIETNREEKAGNRGGYKIDSPAGADPVTSRKATNIGRARCDTAC